jgi:hypothetical protein
MQIEIISSSQDPDKDFAGKGLPGAQVVFYFLSPDYPHKEKYFSLLKKTYPDARLIGCTTSGEIAHDDVHLGTAVSTALKLRHTKIKVAHTTVTGAKESYEAGKTVAKELAAPDLAFIFILSDGLKVNGTRLVRGILENTREDLLMTGGLAGDGVHFKETGVGVDTLPKNGVIAAIGFYGDKLKVSSGTGGGWTKFGHTRRVTRSCDNMLYEMDGKNALELYIKYLGDEAKNLPASGQFFPLCIKPAADSEHEVVRAFLGIDKNEKSLLFAGDVPEGAIAQLTRGSAESIVAGATEAADTAMETMRGAEPRNTVGFLVSCAGRLIVMNQHVSDEIEAVRKELGDIPFTGFYSYGEICNHSRTKKCDLHNQTMTITLLSEDE